jgi:hypothetical protein
MPEEAGEAEVQPVTSNMGISCEHHDFPMHRQAAKQA